MEITLIGVPYQGDITRWGNARAAQAWLDAGLADLLRARGHTVAGPVWIEVPKAERSRDTVTNLGRIAYHTSHAVASAIGAGAFPVVLAGDCTHSIGPFGGLARAGHTPGIIWFDAHGDLHTMATTGSGMLGGMPFAVALGWEFTDWRLAAGLDQPVSPRAAALLGASDLDPEEIDALARHPIARVDAEAMRGLETAERVRAALAPRADAATAWAMHIDLDVAGPEELPSSSTPAPHWPPRERLLEAVRAAATAVPMGSITLAVYNPQHDRDGRGARLGLDVLMAAVDGAAESRGAVSVSKP